MLRHFRKISPVSKAICLATVVFVLVVKTTLTYTLPTALELLLAPAVKLLQTIGGLQCFRIADVGYLLPEKQIIILPLACFALYQSQRFAAGLIGDFSHPAFYVFAVANSFLLLLKSESPMQRLGLLFAKSALYPLVLYFFLLLLPFTPFSVIAIITFGFGFLMLTPTFVMILSTGSLLEDFRFLRSRFNLRIIATVFGLGFLLLPAYLTLLFMHEKRNLQRVLTYVYEPDYLAKQKSDLDPEAVAATIESIERNIQPGRLARGRMPYISNFYNWLVLDNLTLSADKTETLRRIFLGKSHPKPIEMATNGKNGRATRWPKLVSLKADTDELSQKTWIHLEIQNNSSDTWRGADEYVIRFRLPEGVWISNYYLEMNGKREHGILAEKRAATWVYDQIVNPWDPRDPGLLRYLDDGTIELRVFPFDAHETRHTGFEVVHREPFSLEIDHHSIAIAGTPILEPVLLHDSTIVGISRHVKQTLPNYERKPEYHFIVDCSVFAKDRSGLFVNSIRKIMKQQSIDSTEAKLTLLNYETRSIEFHDNWEKNIVRSEKKGGFFLQRAFREILLENYHSRSTRYPVFFVISDHLNQAIFTTGMTNYQATFPESDRFYVCNSTGRTSVHSFGQPFTESGPLGKLADEPKRKVVAWPNAHDPIAYLRDDGEFSVVLASREVDFSNLTLRKHKWESGLLLQGLVQHMNLFSEDTNAKWFSAVKGSFEAGIMTPLVSFISLENEAQKAALLKKQEEVLKANNLLDLARWNQMSEPSLPAMLLVAVLVATTMYFRGKRKSEGIS